MLVFFCLLCDMMRGQGWFIMRQMSELKRLYLNLYAHNENAINHYDLLSQMIDKFKAERSRALKQLDKNDASWYYSNKMIGMTLYTDLFAGNFKKLVKKIPYLQDLGITYVHLMPLLKPRDGENDGGYAVEDYRNVDPRLGTLDDFMILLKAFAKADIKVCIDYVLNHVAIEHNWAQEALLGNKEAQARFFMYDDRKIPDLYDETVPEVLPDKCPGNFTYIKQIDKYVFTSFSDFQWDLNFTNPEVFHEVVEVMLYLANLGVNMLRLDAIPFMWKELNTSCRNLDPIHDLLRMIYLIKQEVAPSLSLLGEAIVEPEQIVKYFGSEKSTECEIMYNANLMVDIYHTFATRDVRLLTIDTNRFQIPSKGTWMNYVRCHDDIGWGFNEQAISAMGFDPFQHKQFLIRFYGQRFPGSFAMGEDYQFNPKTLDARTNGTLASLLGLESALNKKETYKIEEAIRRINLAHALILTYRGIPLIYSGDEIANINDQSYKEDVTKVNEGRWVHRPIMDWKKAERRLIANTIENKAFKELQRMIVLRKKNKYLHGQVNQFALDSYNPHVYILVRELKGKTFMAFFNFSEYPQKVSVSHVRQFATGKYYECHLQGRVLNMDHEWFDLSPYEVIWAEAIES